MAQFVSATLIFWICVHFGFSMTQVADHFLFGRNQEYVVPNFQENFLQSETFRNQVDMNADSSKNNFMSDDFNAESQSIKTGITVFLCQFTFLGIILDFIAKIYVLDYEFFTSYEEETKDSIINWILQAFRLLSIIAGIIFTVQLIVLLLSSGILTTLMSRGGIITGAVLISLSVILNIFESIAC